MHTLMIKAGSGRVFLSPGYGAVGKSGLERRLALVVDGKEVSINCKQARKLAAHLERLADMHPREYNRIA